MNATVIADYRVSDKCRARLTELGFAVIRLPCFRGLSSPVCAHSDLLLFPCGEEIFTFRSYYEENRSLLDSFGRRVICVSMEPCGNYPSEAMLDALAVGDTLYGKKGAVAPELMARYSRFCNVKQGYTRCSVALIAPNAAITADRGIADALRSNGVQVLQISPGGIALPGYDSGFIGGAGGSLGEGRYAFFGNWRLHPDARDIAAFAAQHDVSLISLSEEPLTDYGGLVLLHCSVRQPVEKAKPRR